MKKVITGYEPDSRDGRFVWRKVYSDGTVGPLNFTEIEMSDSWEVKSFQMWLVEEVLGVEEEFSEFPEAKPEKPDHPSDPRNQVAEISAKDNVDPQHYLSRLERLLCLRRDHRDELNEDGRWLLDRSIFATYVDCVHTGRGQQAQEILGRYRVHDEART